jgi:hypothetical protein
MVVERDKLTALDRESIRRVASLRFAQDLAPDAMAGMTAKDKNGVVQVVRLPADGDPTLTRIEKIRERDTAVVDTVNDYYASFHDNMEDSYGSWRQTSFTELEKEMRARSAARTRTVLGAAALIASIFAPTSCSSYDACRIADAARNAGTMGGIAAILSGMKKYADARTHADALKELTQSFQSEVANSRRSPFAEVAAAVTGTLLVCDAWFDVVTARTTSGLVQAGLEAALVEIPLAILCFWMASNLARAVEVALPFLRKAGFRVEGHRLVPPDDSGAP